MGMLSVALSLPLAEECASKKVAGDICSPGKKERKKDTLPTSVRDGEGDRPQRLRSCDSHWLALCTKSNSNHFTPNTATNPEGAHAASSISPPPVQILMKALNAQLLSALLFCFEETWSGSCSALWSHDIYSLFIQQDCSFSESFTIYLKETALSKHPRYGEFYYYYWKMNIWKRHNLKVLILVF